MISEDSQSLLRICGEVINQKRNDEREEWRGAVTADGGYDEDIYAAQRKLYINNQLSTAGTLTWHDLLCADFLFVSAARTVEAKRAAAVDLAATVLAFIDDIDRRQFSELVARPELQELAGEAQLAELAGAAPAPLVGRKMIFCSPNDRLPLRDKIAAWA